MRRTFMSAIIAAVIVLPLGCRSGVQDAPHERRDRPMVTSGYYIQRAIAFAPLRRVMAEGGCQRIRLEFLIGRSSDNPLVIESADPDILSKVRGGLQSAIRPDRVFGSGVGCGTAGTMVLYGRTRCAEVGITPAGFMAGNHGPSDVCCFVSPQLAEVIDELYFDRTAEHIGERTMDGLSSRDIWSHTAGREPVEWESLVPPEREHTEREHGGFRVGGPDAPVFGAPGSEASGFGKLPEGWGGFTN